MHTRDFLPDDVSELSSVAAVDVDVAAGAGGAIVLVVVVVVVSSGCRQQVEEDSDVVAVTVVAPVAAFVAAGDGAAVADDTVFVDSLLEPEKASPLNHLIRILSDCCRGVVRFKNSLLQRYMYYATHRLHNRHRLSPLLVECFHFSPPLKRLNRNLN